MRQLLGRSLATTAVTTLPITIKRVETEAQALVLASLYCDYYQRMALTPEPFVARWKMASSHSHYYLLAAYVDNEEQPCGFIDFQLIPSIFWAPYVGRLDSLHVAHGYDEQQVANALFSRVLEICNGYQVSKIIAVSCHKFEQEIRLLRERMPLDDNPTKQFFMLLGSSPTCG